MTKKGSRTRWTPLSIAAIVLGFLVWWPIGIAAIAYILWGGSVDDVVNDGWRKLRTSSTSSGNSAFDDYRKETLKRLEDEQEAFNDFVERLRAARDHEEFERFMAERGKA